MTAANKEQETAFNDIILARNLKKRLKQLSKNQLILLLLEQVNFSMEQQALNKHLLEQQKKIKGDQV